MVMAIDPPIVNVQMIRPIIARGKPPPGMKIIAWDAIPAATVIPYRKSGLMMRARTWPAARPPRMVARLLRATMLDEVDSDS